MSLSEDQLCEIFADGVRDSTPLRLWLLRQTKFAEYAEVCRLLDKEQMELRPRKRWWRHWWCHVPELQKQRETDIFMVFEIAPDRKFALHIENKRDNYKFNEGQAAAYRPRAQHMLNRPEYLSHSNFQTILIAPMSFQKRYHEEADLFDKFLPYEDVAKFLPAFVVAKISN